MLSPKPVSHTNMEEIRDYFKYADKHMSLAQFSTTYLWRHSTGLLYDIQDDFLYLFEKNYNYAAPLPLGNGDIFKALEKVKEFKQSVCGNNLVYCIGEDKVKLFEDKYQVSELNDFFEYVYLTEDLINLSGRKFHGKRNHLNQFVSNNRYTYERITASDIPLVMNLMDQWSKKKEHSVNLDVEKKAIYEILNYDTGADYRAGAILTDNQVVAFAIGEQISDDMACVYFEKADTDIKGSYTVINNEFSHLLYINRQEDLGISGLKKAKESYNPVFKVKNYFMKL